mgnify:CR=1 FL=1
MSQIQPGGPNIDGVAIVASGRYECGQVVVEPVADARGVAGPSDQVLCAGSAAAPVHVLLAQEEAGGHSAKDMVGKKVGIQPTGVDAAEARCSPRTTFRRAASEIVPIGADMSPLLDRAGRRRHRLADQRHRAEAAWVPIASTCACGTPACASTRCRTTRRSRRSRRSRTCCRNSCARRAQGYAVRERQSRRGGRPAGQGISESRPQRREGRHRRDDGLRVQRPHARPNGWGTMDPAVWQDQISLYSQLGQFSKRTPKLDEVHDDGDPERDAATRA